jgi:uncharacterized protein
MVDPEAAVLVVLTRAPSSIGKRRLFQTLNLPTDQALVRALLLDTLDGSALPGLRRLIAVTPASACGEVRDVAGTIEVMSQADGDLGERMRAAMEALFREGATAVALIGSDLPHIDSAVVGEAFGVLAADHDALVLGPASDGGYYLIGARRVPDVFRDIAWGSNRVLTSTVRAACARGFRVYRLPAMSDVDTVDDLRTAVLSGRAPRVRAWVEAHVPYLIAGGSTAR